MTGSQSHTDAVSMENSLELSTTLVRFYQQQQQQEQLLQHQQQQQQQREQVNPQPQHYYINENQNCDHKDLDETNSKSHPFPLLLHILFSAINQCK